MYCRLTHSLTYSPTRAPTHSPVHPLTHPLTHSLSHSLTQPITHSLAHIKLRWWSKLLLPFIFTTFWTKADDSQGATRVSGTLSILYTHALTHSHSPIHSLTKTYHPPTHSQQTQMKMRFYFQEFNPSWHTSSRTHPLAHSLTHLLTNPLTHSHR